MRTLEYPFVQELITDTQGNVCKVILDYNDYQRLLELLEDEALYKAMIETKNETPMNLEEALADLEAE